MTVENVSNLAASVQARLQNHARATNRPFQELLQYYAMERFLYRLSTSPHRALLAKAIAATFANRETAIDVAPIAFTPEFTEQAATLAQWTAFRRKLPNTECPETLAEVVPILSEFLLPIARTCESGESFEQRWQPGGPWTIGS